MAYRKKTTRRATTGRSYTKRAAPRRKSTSKRAAPRAQVIKIQFSHVPMTPMGAMPNMFDGTMPAPTKPKTSKL